MTQPQTQTKRAPRLANGKAMAMDDKPAPRRRAPQVRAQGAGEQLHRTADQMRDIVAQAENPGAYKGDWLRDAIERGKREPFAIVAEITPGVAKRLLERNPENRHLSIPGTAKLVRDIQAGRWQFNGESIVVAISGELNDGQHRLQAVLNTGVTVTSVIVFGVPRESRETLDTGKARNLADWLGIHGVKNTTTTAAATRMIRSYERSGGTDFSRLTHFSAGELLERAIADTDLHKAVTHALALYFAGGRELASATIMASCLYLVEKIDPLEGRNFIDRVFIGDNITRESAAFRTRRALMLTSERRQGYLAAMVLRGWAAHRGAKVDIVPEYPIPDLGARAE